MAFGKKDVRKIANATRDELGKVQEEYESLMGDVHRLSPAGLLAIAVVGVIVILSLENNFFDLIGLAMVLYPLYVFIKRGAHREGYFEGYYDMMTKSGGHRDSPSTEHPHHQ